MRSTILCIMLSMYFSMMLGATDKEKFIHGRHNIELSIGDPVTLFYNFNKGYSYSNNYQDWFVPDNEIVYKTETSTFVASYAYAIKPWLHLGATALYAGAYDEVIYQPTGEKVAPARQHAFVVMPDIKFEYLRRKYVTLYSGASIGLALALSSGYDLVPNHETLAKWQSATAYQVTFLGLRVGNRAFGSMEIGNGYKGYFNFGIGFRF